jgi:hypothetical protein
MMRVPNNQKKKTILTALALNLNQDREIFGLLAVPWCKRFQELETVALGINSNLDRCRVGGRGLEGVNSRIIALWWQFGARRSREFKWLAIGTNKSIGEGIEGQVAREGKCGHDIGRGNKGVGSRVGVIPSGKVTVVRGYDWKRYKMESSAPK